IECPVEATLRFKLHKNQPLSAPLIESAPPIPQHALDEAWIVVESATDAVAGARAATNRMIDLLVSRWQISDVHAYLLCSVALHLRLSQVVNEPMFTVSASIAKRILPARELFLRPSHSGFAGKRLSLLHGFWTGLSKL